LNVPTRDRRVGQVDAEILIAAIAIAFAAAACQSVTGFGFALVMTPLLAVAWDVKPAVATTQLLSLLVNVFVLAQVREHVSYERLPALYFGFLLGVVPGLLFLDRVDGDVLQITLGVVVILATAVLYFQPSIGGGSDSLRLRIGVGAVSGASGAATSMGGPPVVLYLLGRETVSRFRATLLAYFFPSSIITLLAFVAVGRITDDVLVVGAASAPAIIAGVYAGAWLRHVIDAGVFRRLVVALLVVMSGLIIALTALGLG